MIVAAAPYFKGKVDGGCEYSSRYSHYLSADVLAICARPNARTLRIVCCAPMGTIEIIDTRPADSVLHRFAGKKETVVIE